MKQPLSLGIWCLCAHCCLLNPQSSRPRGLNVTLNGGADSTFSRWVAVGLTASDETGVTGYYLSESPTTPAAGASGWVPTEPAGALVRVAGFTLSTGHGVKTVYAWFRNAAGGISDAVSGSILLAPTSMDNVHVVSLRPDGRELWASSLDTHSTVIVDLTAAGNPVVGEIRPPWVITGHPPDVMYDIAFAPDSRRAYIAGVPSDEYSDCRDCLGLPRLVAIDTASRRIEAVLPFTGIEVPTGSAVVSRDGQFLFLTLAWGNNQGVGKYDLSAQRLAGRITLPGAGCVRLSPDGTRLHVSQGMRTGSVLPPNLFSIVDADRMELIGSVAVGDSPLGSVATPDGRRAYVLKHLSGGPITLLDVQSLAVIRTFETGLWLGAALDFVLSPDERYAYIAVFDPNYLAIFELSTVAPQDRKTRVIPTGIDPFHVTASADGSLIYGTAYTSDEIFVVALANNQVRETIPLRLTAPPAIELYDVCNGASYAPGPLAPGEIVTLFGKGLGPAGIAKASIRPDRTLANSVAGTSVWVNRYRLAPLIYVSRAQVGAVIPYAVGKAATVQVTAGALHSNKLRFEVAESAPALFTAYLSGTGQAAALNEDNSVNSETNPALAGSLVQFFGTGEGQTSPEAADGLIADNVLPKPVLPVGVRIGGMDAGITYFGAAAGAPAGLMQVNARIPLGVSGLKTPIVLTVGGRSSPDGITIAVIAR